jgi:hypothetical protein
MSYRTEMVRGGPGVSCVSAQCQSHSVSVNRGVWWRLSPSGRSRVTADVTRLLLTPRAERLWGS